MSNETKHSGPVDVLAVMDAMGAAVTMGIAGRQENGDLMREARAAVAELIDAADYALRTRDDAGALSDTAEFNLRAALANIGGAK